MRLTEDSLSSHEEQGQGYLRGASFRSALVTIFVVLSLGLGLTFSVVIPPWQAPDEPRHVEYAILLSEKGWSLDQGDLSLDLQQKILSSLRDFDFWRRIGREQPEPLPTSFNTDPFLVRSGTQLADESPLYALLPAVVFRLLPGDDVLLRLYVLRWFSVLLGAATAAIVCLVALRLFPQDRFVMVAIPAFVALLPMFAFIRASANNDVLATLISSLLILQLVRVLHEGLSWRSAVLMGSLVVLSVLAKRTALFTVPLTLVAIPLSRWGHRVSLRRSHKLGLVSCLGLCALLTAVLLTWRGNEPAAWGRSAQAADKRTSEIVAHSGSYSLRLSGGRLVQIIPFNTVRQLRGNSVTLEAWLCSPGREGSVSLLVGDDQGHTMQAFLASGTWRQYTVSHTVSPQARSLRVVLISASPGEEEANPIYFDDLALREAEGPNLLTNGSAEQAALGVQGLLEKITRHVSPQRLLDARSYDLDSLQRYLLYLLLTFAGFWANFGWLTMPLHPFWYALLAAVTMTSAVGLALWGVGLLRQLRREKEWVPNPTDRTLLLFVAGLGLIALQTFLPMIGSSWQPQGRYLFPGLIMIATLFAFGLRQLMRSLKPEPLAVLYVACFLLFNALCLMGYIIPRYYG
jgi:4-amino-4-deoxy-L-arabinose transferase-like glycosyltransferase